MTQADKTETSNTISRNNAEKNKRRFFIYFNSGKFRRMFLAFLLSSASLYAQPNCSSFRAVYPGCGALYKAFKQGERLEYKLYYHWRFLWLQTGEASVNVTFKDFYGMPCYYVTALGRSYPKYDWFYKIRDTLTTYIDTLNFTSMRFYRSTHEASVNVVNDNVFDNKKHIVYYMKEGKTYSRDSVRVPDGAVDILTGVYLTRCIDFGAIGVKDTILVNIYLDGKIYKVHVRYLGKEEVSSSFGRYRCEKISVELIAGTIFREGAKMIVWATDDENHMPLLVEAPLIIGSVRAELESFSGLRNTMERKVK